MCSSWNWSLSSCRERGVLHRTLWQSTFLGHRCKYLDCCWCYYPSCCLLWLLWCLQTEHMYAWDCKFFNVLFKISMLTLFRQGRKIVAVNIAQVLGCTCMVHFYRLIVCYCKSKYTLHFYCHGNKFWHHFDVTSSKNLDFKKAKGKSKKPNIFRIISGCSVNMKVLLVYSELF